VLLCYVQLGEIDTTFTFVAMFYVIIFYFFSMNSLLILINLTINFI